MATTNVTISDSDYNTLVATITAWQAKLEPIKAGLTAVLTNEAQRDKLVARVKTDEDFRLLKKTWQTWRYLDDYFRDIGWRDD